MIASQRNRTRRETKKLKKSRGVSMESWGVSREAYTSCYKIHNFERGKFGDTQYHLVVVKESFPGSGFLGFIKDRHELLVKKVESFLCSSAGGRSGSGGAIGRRKDVGIIEISKEVSQFGGSCGGLGDRGRGRGRGLLGWRACTWPIHINAAAAAAVRGDMFASKWIVVFKELLIGKLESIV